MLFYIIFVHIWQIPCFVAVSWLERREYEPRIQYSREDCDNHKPTQQITYIEKLYPIIGVAHTTSPKSEGWMNSNKACFLLTTNYYYFRQVLARFRRQQLADKTPREENDRQWIISSKMYSIQPGCIWDDSPVTPIFDAIKYYTATQIIEL